jgi:hypothetical protein
LDNTATGIGPEEMRSKSPRISATLTGSELWMEHAPSDGSKWGSPVVTM